MSERVESKQLGISMRLIRHWQPEPMEVEVERDARLILRYLGTIRSDDYEQRTDEEPA